MKRKVLFILAFSCLLCLCLAQNQQDFSSSFNEEDIGVEFKKNELTPQVPFEHPFEEDKPYVIFDMSLNDFLRAMAQRAKFNYVSKKLIQGRVSAVFYATDPVIMAKTATKTNGYRLLVKDKSFVVQKEEKEEKGKKYSKNSIPLSRKEREQFEEILARGQEPAYGVFRYRAKLKPNGYNRSNHPIKSEKIKVMKNQGSKAQAKKKLFPSSKTNNNIGKELKKDHKSR
ncbi:hypothetical protein [Methylacidiphilum caldifontis]|uniref:Secretin/TonB short N-terminal domain-containing protein n=1 Tax=Methylacidiphilum caldifontis TaxID=2795386 RepID=A0A4Y8P788_9BACT|nr:hypothetical protein [Methylacidiphilum caldifontis]QSR88919.1 hypothetical protein IT6_01015 [Methylacidiphilum caldifontis]TFE66173.1 hypothetical protein A7Q10_02230 [Methylacidiphilum caldifontis]